ncbi:hypothetical protein ABZ479_05905 [Streptomyces sp. NPDC005722]
MRRAFDRPAAECDDDHHDAVAAALIHLAAPSPADPAVLAVDVSAGTVAAGRARARRAAPSGAIDWR